MSTKCWESNLSAAVNAIRSEERRVGNDMQVTVLYEKATANYVPAAAVIRRWRALSGIIGRKEGAGGTKGLW